MGVVIFCDIFQYSFPLFYRLELNSKGKCCISQFFEIYVIDYAITVFPFFSPPYSPPLCTPPPHQHSSTLVHTYKFFGFSIFHTILNLPPSILYLPFMLLIPCTFTPIPPSPSPGLQADNIPCDLHFLSPIKMLLKKPPQDLSGIQ